MASTVEITGEGTITSMTIDPPTIDPRTTPAVTLNEAAYRIMERHPTMYLLKLELKSLSTLMPEMARMTRLAKDSVLKANQLMASLSVTRPVVPSTPAEATPEPSKSTNTP